MEGCEVRLGVGKPVRGHDAGDEPGEVGEGGFESWWV